MSFRDDSMERLLNWAAEHDVRIAYHRDSQYPHIDMNQAAFEKLRDQIGPPQRHLQQFGAIGAYWHTPIFVDRCPDGPPVEVHYREPYEEIRNVDGEVCEAEIVD